MLSLTERYQRLRQISKKHGLTAPALHVLQTVNQRLDEERFCTLMDFVEIVKKRNRLLSQREKLISHDIIVKPVGNSCNLGCEYCLNRLNQVSKSLLIMENNVLESVIATGLSNVSHKINFTWHGGEPLLAGINFFNRVIQLQQKLNFNNKIVENFIQTNGVLINRKWASFFKQHNFRVSISIDGPAEVHNRYRYYLSGKGSFNKILNNIGLLKEKNININVIAVITGNVNITPQKFINFFVEHDIRNFRVNPCCWPEDIALSSGEYANFICGLFDIWLDKGMSYLRIHTLEEIMAPLIGRKPITCWMGKCSSFIGVEPNGDAWPCCDRVLPSEQYKWGNVLESDLSTIIQSESAQKFRTMEQKIPDDCTNCQWLSFCRGGCIHERIVQAGTMNAPHPLCKDYQQIFSHVAERIDEVLTNTSLT